MAVEIPRNKHYGIYGYDVSRSRALCMIGSGFMILAFIFLLLGYKGRSDLESGSLSEYVSLGADSCQIIDIDYKVDTAYATTAPKWRCQEAWTYSFVVTSTNTSATSLDKDQVYKSDERSRFVCKKRDCEKCQSSSFQGKYFFNGNDILINVNDTDPLENFTTQCWQSDCSNGQRCMSIFDPKTELERRRNKNRIMILVGWCAFGLMCIAYLCACSLAFYDKEEH